MITVRQLKKEEVGLFKEVRLAALKDAPYAFSSTYEAALQRSAESWREQVEHTTQGNDRATFIAFSDDQPIGMAALYRREDTVDVGELLQVWVRPEYRSSLVAWELMDAILIWADENNFSRIIAGVTKENTRALKFYLNYGFTITGEFSTDDPNAVYIAREVKG